MDVAFDGRRTLNFHAVGCDYVADNLSAKNGVTRVDIPMNGTRATEKELAGPTNSAVDDSFDLDHAAALYIADDAHSCAYHGHGAFGRRWIES